MTGLSLYGTIMMCLIIGVLVGLIALHPMDSGVAPVESFLADARADQLRRHAVLGTPTDEHPIVTVTRMDVPPRGQGIVEPHVARHRRQSAPVMDQRPSLTTVGLNEALAWLTVDRVKRDAQRAEFEALLGVYAH